MAGLLTRHYLRGAAADRIYLRQVLSKGFTIPFQNTFVGDRGNTDSSTGVLS